MARGDGGKPSPLTLGAAIRRASEELQSAGVQNPGGDARRLIAHALRVALAWLTAHEDEPVTPEGWSACCAAVARRAAREPLQHVTGRQGFWTLDLAVDSRVLVPRPETEHLVEAALEALRGIGAPRIADVGTGSGCVALALVAEIPLARLVATDVSEAALEVARENAAETGLGERVELAVGDLTAPLRGRAPFHAVVANLPYVAEHEWAELQPEVRDHEPRRALLGGADGLDLVLRLVDEAPGVLATRGWLGLEVGQGQARRVVEALRAGGWADVRVRPDFAGIERVVEARRPG